MNIYSRPKTAHGCSQQLNRNPPKSQKVKTTQTSIEGWLGKQNGACPHNGQSLALKRNTDGSDTLYPGTYSLEGSQKHRAQWKTPVTKDHKDCVIWLICTMSTWGQSLEVRKQIKGGWENGVRRDSGVTPHGYECASSSFFPGWWIESNIRLWSRWHNLVDWP